MEKQKKKTKDKINTLIKLLLLVIFLIVILVSFPHHLSTGFRVHSSYPGTVQFEWSGDETMMCIEVDNKNYRFDRVKQGSIYPIASGKHTLWPRTLGCKELTEYPPFTITIERGSLHLSCERFDEEVVCSFYCPGLMYDEFTIRVSEATHEQSSQGNFITNANPNENENGSKNPIFTEEIHNANSPYTFSNLEMEKSYLIQVKAEGIPAGSKGKGTNWVSTLVPPLDLNLSQDDSTNKVKLHQLQTKKVPSNNNLIQVPIELISSNPSSKINYPEYHVKIEVDQGQISIFTQNNKDLQHSEELINNLENIYFVHNDQNKGINRNTNKNKNTLQFWGFENDIKQALLSLVYQRPTDDNAGNIKKRANIQIEIANRQLLLFGEDGYSGKFPPHSKRGIQMALPYVDGISIHINILQDSTIVCASIVPPTWLESDHGFCDLNRKKILSSYIQGEKILLFEKFLHIMSKNSKQILINIHSSNCISDLEYALSIQNKIEKYALGKNRIHFRGDQFVVEKLDELDTDYNYSLMKYHPLEKPFLQIEKKIARFKGITFHANEDKRFPYNRNTSPSNSKIFNLHKNDGVIAFEDNRIRPDNIKIQKLLNLEADIYITSSPKKVKQYLANDLHYRSKYHKDVLNINLNID
ncbi:glycerophosphoryl diester phosphodiesterase [Anaeramoeba flamelloides]|uniref:Glycerophosphoryl diester phosphodiesterase n=1 Tax=Anaeramoeba flamelloides TaxID=1746091 RepID=A0ABQ8Z5B4_9EUKA|nr:glycerophosphoryl diester phosphodiesterase [Anaeramoeba flamelloides]